MENKITTIKNENVEPESIEWGSPTKGGKIKIYTDMLDIEKTQRKIVSAIECLEFLNRKIGTSSIIPKKKE